MDTLINTRTAIEAEEVTAIRPMSYEAYLEWADEDVHSVLRSLARGSRTEKGEQTSQT